MVCRLSNSMDPSLAAESVATDRCHQTWPTTGFNQ